MIIYNNNNDNLYNNNDNLYNNNDNLRITAPPLSVARLLGYEAVVAQLE